MRRVKKRHDGDLLGFNMLSQETHTHTHTL